MSDVKVVSRRHRAGKNPPPASRPSRDRLHSAIDGSASRTSSGPTRPQYALVDRVLQFGWPRETIMVIDDDLGRSGATIEGRLGFQRLVHRFQGSNRYHAALSSFIGPSVDDGMSVEFVHGSHDAILEFLF